MKYIPFIKSVIFSFFLIFIYWDSTLWKFSEEYLGSDKERIAYGITSIGLLIIISVIYFGLFRLLEFKKTKKEKKKLKDSRILAVILIVIFCFKFFIFGDLGVNIEEESSNSGIEIENPRLVEGSLKTYHVGQVKGGYGWYKIYRGFYLLEDLKTNKEYVVCSGVVSGDNLRSDIIYEFSEPEYLFLYLENNIKASEKEEVDNFLNSISKDSSTKIYYIKSEGLVMFAMHLLYWAVLIVVFIGVFFYVALSFPD